MPDDATIVSLRSDTVEAPAAKREAPQKQPERPAAMPAASDKAARSPRRPWTRWALFALAPLALSSAWGQVAHSSSKTGVCASAIALLGPGGAIPQPSITTRHTQPTLERSGPSGRLTGYPSRSQRHLTSGFRLMLDAARERARAMI